jgi:hypothetical protein
MEPPVAKSRMSVGPPGARFLTAAAEEGLEQGCRTITGVQAKWKSNAG